MLYERLKWHLLSECLEELLHVRGQVSVEAAEGPQHSPDHLQSHGVEARQFSQQQSVHGPEQTREEYKVRDKSNINSTFTRFYFHQPPIH